MENKRKKCNATFEARVALAAVTATHRTTTFIENVDNFCVFCKALVLQSL